jgi:hypothetical protein
MMEVRAGMEGEIDTMLRGSNFKVREGLAGQLNQEQLNSLLLRSVTAVEAGLDVPRQRYGKRGHSDRVVR